MRTTVEKHENKHFCLFSSDKYENAAASCGNGLNRIAGKSLNVRCVRQTTSNALGLDAPYAWSVPFLFIGVFPAAAGSNQASSSATTTCLGHFCFASFNEHFLISRETITGGMNQPTESPKYAPQILDPVKINGTGNECARMMSFASETVSACAL